MKGGTYNLKTLRRPTTAAREVHTLMVAHRLGFLCLQEVETYRRALRALARAHGYTYVSAGDVGIMARGRARGRTAHWLADGWFGRQVMRWHPPRTFLAVTINGLRVSSVHGPPGVVLHPNGRVAPADRADDYLTLMARVTRFLERAGPRVAAGDWNVTAVNAAPHSPLTTSRATGSHLCTPTRLAIDYAIEHGCTITSMTTDTTTKLGSDHRPVIFEVHR